MVCTKCGEQYFTYEGAKLYEELAAAKAEIERLSNIEIANKAWTRNDAVTFGKLYCELALAREEIEQINQEGSEHLIALEKQLTQANERIEYLEGLQVNRRLIMSKEREQKLLAALEFYADKSKWHQFISGGNIGSAQDGDFAMAFDDGEDSPWVIAARAIEAHKGGGVGH
jgi:hypothetical protein